MVERNNANKATRYMYTMLHSRLRAVHTLLKMYASV